MVRGQGEASGVELTGAKHKALFAILATAPNGRATRTHLQQMLWGTTTYDGGQQSLRRALSDIKRVLGDALFDEVIAPTNAELRLDLSRVSFVGQPGRGAFLEGLDIPEPAFEAWRDQIRQTPDQIYSLFGPVHATPEQAVLPAVSILPFRVIMGDASHATLGDYLAEQICRSMSRSRLIAVISHLSARKMAQKSLDLTEVREALKVDYFLSGSLKASGDKIVLDVDFLDARTGRILWTRHFNHTLGDFISGESGMEHETVSAIGRAIASQAIQHTGGRRVKEIEDHHLLMSGVGKLYQLRLASFVESREILKEAIRRAPQTAEAHAWLAHWHIKYVFNGWSTDRAKDAQSALDSAAQALDIDPENAFCLTMDGAVRNTLFLEKEEAGAKFGAALALNPNEAMCHLQQGVLQAFTDNGEEAVASVEMANRLSPIDPFGYFFQSLTATAYVSAERWEEALAHADQSLIRNDRHTSTLRVKLTALYHLARMDEAQATLDLLKRREPDFSVENYAAHHPAAAYKTGQYVLAALKGLEADRGISPTR
ncbi:MAG: hypothetical protein AAF618_03720 [Pseudomonadota bacterium]